jgi:hypothetical protein
MKDKKLFFQFDKVGFVLCTALLGALTGCVGYVDRQGQGSVYVEPAVVVQDDYVYYPDYQVYYSSSRHQYAYREGNVWVSRPEPQGVRVNVLRSSPSVRMDFHDSPANHHAAVVQKYPKNWRPSGTDQGRKENQKDDQHGENNGR